MRGGSAWLACVPLVGGACEAPPSLADVAAQTASTTAPDTTDSSTSTGDDATRTADGSGWNDSGSDTAETDGNGGAPSAAWFVDVTAAAGLTIPQGQLHQPPDCLIDDVGHEGVGEHCLVERMSGGAAAGDYDGDGWIDLFVTGLDGGHLYRNAGDGTFTETTTDTGVTPPSPTNGAAWADVDDDGDIDLYLTVIAGDAHLLYINDGTGHFIEEAITRGAAIATGLVHAGTTPAFGDYDLDGDLDLYVGEWRADDTVGTTIHHARLLRNIGGGIFEDVTESAGVDGWAEVAAAVDAKPGIYVFAPAFVDLDGDLYPELTIAADFGTSRLFWNNGDGTFDDLTEFSGVGLERNAMGSTFGDLDADGDLDWFVTAVYEPTIPGVIGNRLYRNEGDRTFTDVTESHGLENGGWGWGAAMLDADGDAYLDIVMTSGWFAPAWTTQIMHLWLGPPTSPMPEATTDAGLDITGQGRGLLVFDYDRDGDQDILTLHFAEPPRLFRNDTPPKNHLRIHPQTPTGAPALGAIVEIRRHPDAPWQQFQIGTQTNFLTQSEPVAHVPLDDDPTPIADLQITWPATNQTHHLQNLPPNTTLHLLPPG